MPIDVPPSLAIEVVLLRQESLPNGFNDLMSFTTSSSLLSTSSSIHALIVAWASVTFFGAAPDRRTISGRNRQDRRGRRESLQ